MSSFAVCLLIVSTFMHAAWNVLVRRRGGVAACIWRMQVAVVVAGAIPALAALLATRCLTSTALLCLLGSGLSCGFYYVFLGRGYESADFTTVYPVARSLPVLLVALGDTLRGRPPTTAGWLGMALVALGCLLVPLESFRRVDWRIYFRRSSVWILLTALGTVGYSLFDKLGTESIARGPMPAAVYGYVFFVTAALSYWALQRLLGARGRVSREVGWKTPALAGLLGFLAYWLVLWAYQFTAQASYVVAFRQFSIVIGVVLGLVVFRETGRTVRLVGSVVITAGLVLLTVWGG